MDKKTIERLWKVYTDVESAVLKKANVKKDFSLMVKMAEIHKTLHGIRIKA